MAITGLIGTGPLSWNKYKSGLTALSTHSVREVKGREWVVSSGWWARPALVRSGYGDRGQETWTGGCWTNDLHRNDSNDYWRLPVTVCMGFIWPRHTLFRRQGRSLWQGAGGGSVEDPLPVLIIGGNVCWWHKQSLTWWASLIICMKMHRKTIIESWEYVSPHWYSLHKAPPVGKAGEFPLSSLQEHQWPREGQHRESGGGNLRCYMSKAAGLLVVFTHSLRQRLQSPENTIQNCHFNVVHFFFQIVFTKSSVS